MAGWRSGNARGFSWKVRVVRGVNGRVGDLGQWGRRDHGSRRVSRRQRGASLAETHFIFFVHITHHMYTHMNMYSVSFVSTYS